MKKHYLEEYKKILAIPSVEKQTRANINYLIGKIYFEDVKDYDEAAAYYIRAREYDPDGSFNLDASKNLITCLEKIGHGMDAQRELREFTTIDTTKPEPGDKKVAEINGDPIWLSELDNEIQSLPKEMQERFKTPAGKRMFLQNMVSTEIMYRAALREDYQNNPEIVKRKEMLEKQLLVEKYLTDNVLPNVKIDTMDIKNYYEAHKGDRYDNQPLDSVKAKVLMDYQTDKTQSALRDYISKMPEAKTVRLYEQQIQ